MQQQVVQVQTQPKKERMTLDQLSDQVFEKIATASKLILLICVAYGAYKVSPSSHTPLILDQIWMIAQAVTLDVSGPGLWGRARRVENTGARRFLRAIAVFLLLMGTSTMIEIGYHMYYPNQAGETANTIAFILFAGRMIVAGLYMFASHGLDEDKDLHKRHAALVAEHDELKKRHEDLRMQHTGSLKLQQDQARQYVALRDEHHTLSQAHDLLLSDHTMLKSQHVDLVATNQTITAQYADASRHCQEIEKQVVTLTEERDSLKNILSVMSAKQVSQTAKKEVSQPQEKLSQTPVTRVSRSTKNDSKKLSHSTPVKLSRVDTPEEREAKMEEALRELTDAGERVSARTLSDKTGYNRNITNDWLKNRNVTPQNDTSETVTDDERDTGELAIVHIEKLA